MFYDLACLCLCLSGEGEHRQVHHRPEGSGQEHQGSGHSLRRLQTPNRLFLDATLLIFLYRINYFLLKGCLCVYSIYTSADGEIKAPLIRLQLCVCVFVIQRPYLFLALEYFDHVLVDSTH